MIRINSWMGEGLLLVVPLSENLARIAGSGEIISLNDDMVNYIGLLLRKCGEGARSDPAGPSHCPCFLSRHQPAHDRVGNRT